jgi:hypothetical protein
MVEARKKRSVLDGPGFGRGIRGLLTEGQQRKIEELGTGASRGVVDYLNRHMILARRVKQGDVVDAIEVRRHSDGYRRLGGGRQTVKHVGRPPRSVWRTKGTGLDEPWGGRDQEGTIIDP